MAMQNNLGGSTPQSSPQVQVPHPTQEREGSDRLVLGEDSDSSESMAGNKTECVQITHICATGIAPRLRRIPVGFYVVIKTENEIKRTSNKPASVSNDVVEWDDEIVLPSDRSSIQSFTIFASFELGPTLGDGEALCEFETTVVELLDDPHGQSELITFVEQSDGEVNTLLSFEAKIERLAYVRIEDAGTSNVSGWC